MVIIIFKTVCLFFKLNILSGNTVTTTLSEFVEVSALYEKYSIERFSLQKLNYREILIVLTSSSVIYLPSYIIASNLYLLWSNSNISLKT
ncbi:hypothetical protein KPH14_003504 [Odynerus spinipes]|uniref:Uncharacterized protein n=1 Tax=Odynerus spinipes TaxID=1348599 RepID=A0AAD9RDE6_9HYME|nr:hypothetical protein KPH14_003504 [Odynerus spinipes]